MLKLHISKGNSKLGGIMNVSLPPVITCRKGVPCAADGCYAIKFYRMYKGCKTAWDDNLEYYKATPGAFFEDVSRAAVAQAYFRWFVSGDIVDAEFFEGMVRVAEECKGTQFLCFTKQFEIVNAYMDEHGSTPSNLHIIFSTWEGFTLDNPYNFPESAVIPPEWTYDDIPAEWKICGGNCGECICRGIGCWVLKNGETIAFRKH